ncbi:origin recognition complex subunit 2 [Phellopilus nigrolimitatus]|nr:origin recognition complex subunit 2 [Phellopilus nigrolimitatus]
MDSADDRSHSSDDDDDDDASDAGADADIRAEIVGKELRIDDRPSTFDAYFTQAARASRTSAHVFSQLVPPLTPDQHHAIISTLQSALAHDAALSSLAEAHARYFPAFLAELAAGFNLLFYGLGSKRAALNSFARLCAQKGHVAVANAFFPSFALKDLLASAEQLVRAPDVPGAGTGLEAQCRRILAKYINKPHARPLFLIIHNIDAPALRTPRARACLAVLAAHPAVHLAASVDHIMAPLLWSTSDAFARGETGGFNWLWHDLTSMRPYNFELAYADRTSYAGASPAGQRGGTGASAAAAPGAVSEGAAQHVLASVTLKAKRLFALLCVRQAGALSSASASTSAESAATSYELLFAAARDDFIATNDTAMRALLGEFRDHGLVRSTAATEGGEALWIPLPREALLRLVNKINGN